MRAGLAGMLGGLAAGFHWLEERTSRGLRPWVLGVVALAVIAVVTVGVIHAWHGGPHRFSGRDVEHHLGPPPAGKPEGKPEGRLDGRPEGRSEGRSDSRPRAPVPPPPPTPPPPPPPPAGGGLGEIHTGPSRVRGLPGRSPGP